MKQYLLCAMLLASCVATHAQYKSGDKIELHINFESRKAEIPVSDTGTLREVVQLLQKNPTMRVSVEGHTDNGGDPKKNIVLSSERARAVADGMISRGIKKDRLSVKGWGGERPLTDNNTEDAKARNRRVEVIVL
jgi:OmpA-OmpF porin, OOP family